MTTANHADYTFVSPSTLDEQASEYERLVGEKPSCRFEGRWDFLHWVDRDAPVLVCETHGESADGLVYALPDPIVGTVGLCRPEADYVNRLLADEAWAAAKAEREDS